MQIINYWNLLHSQSNINKNSLSLNFYYNFDSIGPVNKFSLHNLSMENTFLHSYNNQPNPNSATPNWFSQEPNSLWSNPSLLNVSSNILTPPENILINSIL